MSMCRVFSCVVGRECLLWPVHFLGKTLLVFTLLCSLSKAKFTCNSRCFLTSYLCIPVPYLSLVQLFVTLWMVAHQSPLSMEFSRLEYRSGSAIPFSTSTSPQTVLNIWFSTGAQRLRFLQYEKDINVLAIGIFLTQLFFRPYKPPLSPKHTQKHTHTHPCINEFFRKHPCWILCFQNNAFAYIFVQSYSLTLSPWVQND